MQKYGHRANDAARQNDPNNNFLCQVCGENAGFNWSDLHGEGMCNRCGIPYNLKEKPFKININDEWVPVFKKYWKETQDYIGAGQILIERDYPECVKGMQRFYAWLGEHPEHKPEEQP